LGFGGGLRGEKSKDAGEKIIHEAFPLLGVVGLRESWMKLYKRGRRVLNGLLTVGLSMVSVEKIRPGNA